MANNPPCARLRLQGNTGLLVKRVTFFLTFPGFLCTFCACVFGFLAAVLRPAFCIGVMTWSVAEHDKCFFSLATSSQVSHHVYTFHSASVQVQRSENYITGNPCLRFFFFFLCPLLTVRQRCLCAYRAMVRVRKRTRCFTGHLQGKRLTWAMHMHTCQS